MYRIKEDENGRCVVQKRTLLFFWRTPRKFMSKRMGIAGNKFMAPTIYSSLEVALADLREKTRKVKYKYHKR